MEQEKPKWIKIVEKMHEDEEQKKRQKVLERFAGKILSEELKNEKNNGKIKMEREIK